MNSLARCARSLVIMLISKNYVNNINAHKSFHHEINYVNAANRYPPKTDGTQHFSPAVMNGLKSSDAISIQHTFKIIPYKYQNVGEKSR